MKRFNYMFNHKKDEAYMKKMCDQGWTTKSLAKGLNMFHAIRFGPFFVVSMILNCIKAKKN